MPYAGYSFPYGTPSGRGHTQTHIPYRACMALTPALLPTRPLHQTWVCFPHVMYHNSHTATICMHQTHTPLSYQTAAASALSRPGHLHSPSLSKCPASPPSKDHPDTTLPKCPRSFRSDAQNPSQSTAYQSRELYSQAPNILPVCAVCLGRHKHSVPVVFCAAKRTWDDQFKTFIKHFNKALRIRETRATLCSSWQCDNSCFEKHDSMHLCSGCGALTHGTSKCPRTQKAPPQNSI